MNTGKKRKGDQNSSGQQPQPDSGDDDQSQEAQSSDK